MPSWVPIVVISIFGFIVGLIGFLMKRSLSQIDANISKIFSTIEKQSEALISFKEEVIKNYATKLDCERSESLLRDVYRIFIEKNSSWNMVERRNQKQ